MKECKKIVLLFAYKGLFESFPDLRNHLDDIDQNSPNCVLVGYARDDFTYEAMNSAFQILMSLKEPLIVSLGCGYFYYVFQIFANF